MRAAIKKVHSPDVMDLHKYQPRESDDFCFLMQVMVGPKDEEGEESFDFIVCTPTWLLNHHKIEDVILGKSYILVFQFNFERIMMTLEKLVGSFSGNTWTEIAEKISRFGKWEFEDYREFSGG